MRNRFRYRGATGLLLGLSMLVPVGSAYATGQADPTGAKPGSNAMLVAQLNQQKTVLGSSERLLSSALETGRGRLIESGAEKIGAVTTRDEALPSKDQVQILPDAGEVVGDEWLEYEIVRRQKAFNRMFSQQEKQYEIYAEQTRTAYTYQVTDQIRLVETQPNPGATPDLHKVSDTTETRSEVRYSAWSENGKRIRVDLGTSTRTWGPELVYTPVPDEKRLSKRISLMPPGGMAAGWWLKDAETFRYFLAGKTPPADARQATDAKGESIRQGTGPALGGANSDWTLVNAENIRYFLKGATPPAGAVAATPEQREAMVNPVNSGWALANSELIRYFVPGKTAPADAKLASPEQQAAIKAGVPNDWQLVHVQTIRDFLAGNAPPAGATRSKEAAGTDPAGNGDWAMEHLQSFRFFVAIPGTFENPAPVMPPQPEPREIYGEIVPRIAEAGEWVLGPISYRREGTWMKRDRKDHRPVPQYQKVTVIPRGYGQETYTTYESREVPLNLGGKQETATLQVPVKNYRWVIKEFPPIVEWRRYAQDWIESRLETLPDVRLAEATNLVAPGDTRSSSFQGDTGSGSRAVLSASTLREQLGANRVTPSTVKDQAPAGNTYDVAGLGKLLEGKPNIHQGAIGLDLITFGGGANEVKFQFNGAKEGLVKLNGFGFTGEEVPFKLAEMPPLLQLSFAAGGADFRASVQIPIEQAPPAAAAASAPPAGAAAAEIDPNAIRNEAPQAAFSRDAILGTWVDVKEPKRKLKFEKHNQQGKVDVEYDGILIEDKLKSVTIGKRWSASKGGRSYVGTFNDDGTLTLRLEGWLSNVTYTLKKR